MPQRMSRLRNYMVKLLKTRIWAVIILAYLHIQRKRNNLEEQKYQSNQKSQSKYVFDFAKKMSHEHVL